MKWIFSSRSGLLWELSWPHLLVTARVPISHRAYLTCQTEGSAAHLYCPTSLHQSSSSCTPTGRLSCPVSGQCPHFLSPPVSVAPTCCWCVPSPNFGTAPAKIQSGERAESLASCSNACSNSGSWRRWWPRPCSPPAQSLSSQAGVLKARRQNQLL